MKQCIQCQLPIREYNVDNRFCSIECQNAYKSMNQTNQYLLDIALGKHTDYTKLSKYNFHFRHIVEYFNNKCDELVTW